MHLLLLKMNLTVKYKGLLWLTCIPQNTFEMNWSVNCKPDPTSQHLCLHVPTSSGKPERVETVIAGPAHY